MKSVGCTAFPSEYCVSPSRPSESAGARASSVPSPRRNSWPGLSVHCAGLSAKYCSFES